MTLSDVFHPHASIDQYSDAPSEEMDRVEFPPFFILSASLQLR